MLEVISMIASKDANLDRATLWMPKQYFTDSVYCISKEIVGGRKPQGHEFNAHLYNAVNFGECIEAWRYAVHLCREGVEIKQHLIKFKPSQSEAKIYDFNKCLKIKAPTGKTTLKVLVYTRRILFKYRPRIISQK